MKKKQKSRKRKHLCLQCHEQYEAWHRFVGRCQKCRRAIKTICPDCGIEFIAQYTSLKRCPPCREKRIALQKIVYRDNHIAKYCSQPHKCPTCGDMFVSGKHYPVRCDKCRANSERISAERKLERERIASGAFSSVQCEICSKPFVCGKKRHRMCPDCRAGKNFVVIKHPPPKYTSTYSNRDVFQFLRWHGISSEVIRELKAPPNQ